ncbi:MAG: transporter substrate-binding domain-containing protein [Chloroflexota bacterium]|jgi:polar amino acid transport system substrate-binding protein
MGTSSRRAIAVTSAALLALTLAAAPAAAQDEPDHLQRILDRGLIVMSTDPLYPPQSFLDDAGEIVGFDIDVGQEIANRLGVDFIPTPTPWDVVSSGRWADRMDFSVGSMTITVPRMENIDFTQGYRFDEAGMALREGVEVSGPEDFVNLRACVGTATTYFDYLNGTLNLGERTAEYIAVEPPAFGDIQTRDTDRNCADEWGAGRADTDVWVTSQATIDQAVEEGLPVVPYGEPVFYEPLAVAFDNSVEDNDSLVARVDEIIGELHEEGFLRELSMKWYGEDLTSAGAE